jgi:DmsE family decaheme c-type cytochrome
VDCHRAHYNVPPGTPATTEANLAARTSQGQRIQLTGYRQDSEDRESLRGTSNNLGAVAPYVCYKCHCDMQEMQEIAGPHQICGPNGFNCTTCHDAHGKLLEYSRKDLCLQCHKGAPTMAYHSSVHAMEGVACTDCHNPHPKACVPRVANMNLTGYSQIRRPNRLPMSVQDPDVCYKCHQEIYGLNALPSHHPIKEGKMVCSDCHDGHGQFERNLKEGTVNQVCYRCHAEKQGPYVYEHPPVTEDCGYCHNPHGAVANNLLHQPTTFLCLRCHSGHRRRHSFASIDENSSSHLAVDAQNAFYTDCTVCHTQIHGSDLPSPVRKQALRR